VHIFSEKQKFHMPIDNVAVVGLHVVQFRVILLGAVQFSVSYANLS
jgi:hypothetical protein